MKKKFIFMVIVVSLLAAGLSFISCDNGSGSSDTPPTGTFQIRITGLSSSMMQDCQAGHFSIGLYRAGEASLANAPLGGRDTSLGGSSEYPDSLVSGYYQFYIWNLAAGEIYIGTSGDYDIGFIVSGGTNNGTVKLLRNVHLEVNKLNTVSFSLFSDYN